MPEWNLVSSNRSSTIVGCLGISLLLALMQTGCSNLGQPRSERELFPLPPQVHSREPVLESDELEIQPEPLSELDLTRVNESSASQFSNDNFSNDTNDTIAKWVAESRQLPPAPSIQDASIGNRSAQLSEQPCDHGQYCDCYKNKQPPRLAFAEPTDPPADARLVPASGIVSQPLVPIVNDSLLNQKPFAEASNSYSGSLQPFVQASIEKPVAITGKPVMAVIADHPIATTVRPMEYSNLPPIAAGAVGMTRVASESPRHSQGESKLMSPTNLVCESCQSSDCDGGCKLNSHQSRSTDLKPVITTAFEAPTAPPDPTIQLDEPSTIEELRSAALQVMTTEMLSVPTSFQPPAAPVCKSCHLPGCTDPHCGQTTTSQTPDVESVSGGDFEIPVRDMSIPIEPVASVAFHVSHAIFCTEVSGFGQFKPFHSTTFRSGQNILIYCEVENQYSEIQDSETTVQYKTRLQGSFVIYDGQGVMVEQIKYPVVEDIARRRRRDFYMYFPAQLRDLPAGQYRMELSVEDLGSQSSDSIKTGLEFQIE